MMLLVISFIGGVAVGVSITAQFTDWTTSAAAGALFFAGIAVGRLTMGPKTAKRRDV